MMNNDPTQYLQFDDENELTPTQETNGPVTVLGRTFVNDEARREYFRSELRKKLPELRKIEGFPIGEDDDIIALSDPPYYTACPNPWLNDFIAEWEAEKIDLEAGGIRTSDFEVSEPYTSNVSELRSNPIYNTHTYHTKVPHPAIMRYILKYTQPGDVVFDGFCGTGMTAVAANMCGSSLDVKSLNEKDACVGVRHAICSDLSPIASLIAAAYNTTFNPAIFLSKAKSLLKKLDEELGWMYETKVGNQTAKINYCIWTEVFACPNCNTEISLWDTIVDEPHNTILDSFSCPICGTKNTKKTIHHIFESAYDPILKDVCSVLKTRITRINYTLPNGSRGEKEPDETDIQNFARVLSYPIPTDYSFRMPEGNEARRNDKYGITHSHQFYTIRNYIFLSRLNSLISDDPVLKAWFTSAQISCSKMWKYMKGRKGGSLMGTFYIPSMNVEQNPLGVLDRKISTFVSSFYETRNKSVISVVSATDLKSINNNVIDYIFTDPPFGANISYSELNTLWESWLKIFTNNKEEAIVNPAQNKTLFDYQALMNASLKEFYRVLKPGKWLTMEFSNTSAAVWNSIQNALQGVGFVVANVSALDKQQGSFKAVTTTTAVKQDLIISCFKPSDSLIQKFDTLDFYGDEKNVYEGVHTFIDELLSHLPVTIVNEKKTTAVVERSPKILYDRLIAFFVQRGQPIPMDAGKFQRFLRDSFVERDDMFFTAEQALQYDELRRENPGTVTLALFVGSESEGIQWLKRELLDNPQTYQDIQPKWIKDLVSPKKGDSIPELLDILKENFLQDDEGRWYIPDAENEADLERVRQQRLLREFKGYADETAQRARVKIKEARLEALRAGFKNCYQNKDFETIVRVGDRIPQTLLTEDEILLQYYDIASSRI